MKTVQQAKHVLYFSGSRANHARARATVFPVTSASGSDITRWERGLGRAAGPEPAHLAEGPVLPHPDHLSPGVRGLGRRPNPEKGLPGRGLGREYPRQARRSAGGCAIPREQEEPWPTGSPVEVDTEPVDEIGNPYL